MWYVELLVKTYNAGDQTFYDAIKIYEEKSRAEITCPEPDNLYNS